MKNIEINITTGKLKLVSQKKFISVEALNISRFNIRSAKYAIAGRKSNTLIGKEL